MTPLDAEEATYAAEALAAERRQGELLVSGAELVVARRGAEFMPFVIGWMLAAVLGGMLTPLAGGASGALILVVFFVHAGRRISRLVLESDARLVLPGHATIVWTKLRSVSVSYRRPFASTERERVYGTTLDLVFVLESGARVRLARGQIFRRKPTRAHVPLDRLEAWLRAAAERGGMRVMPDAGGGWTASRWA